MLANQFLLVLFKLINFVLVIAILTYVVKKYVLPSFKDKVISYKAYFNKLVQQRNDDAVLYQQLIKQTEQQAIEIEQLSQKLTQWQKAIEQCRMVQDQQQELIRSHRIQKRALQQETIGFIKASTVILPEALHETAQKLQKEFMEDEQKGQEYINQLLVYMKKSIS